MAAISTSGRIWPVAFTLTIAFGAIARIVALGHWPGINADEAWYGVTLQEFLSGRPTLLRTPPGNPLNPVHSLPLAVLLALFDPTPALLRIPELFWGMLTVLLAYPLLERPLGRRAAILVTMLLAVSPTAVAYSRFGWDPSGTPFVALLAIALALRNRPVMAGLCLLAALVVHPTNVFLAPIVAAAWGPFAATTFGEMSAGARRRLRITAAATAAISLPTAWWLLRGVAANPNTSLPSVVMVIARVVLAQSWIDLLAGITGLVSGVTTAAFVSGPLPPQAALIANLVSGLSLSIPIILGWRAFRAHRHARWLIAGMLVSLIIFQVVAGPDATLPARERYALFALVPLLIICALGIDALAVTQPALATVSFSLTYACLVAMLCGGYFYPLVARGGDSAPAFRTGSVEPKLAAYQAIEADSAGADVVAVIAEDWWLYWPLRYLAGADPRVHVEMMAGANQPGGLYPAGSGPRPYPHRPDRSYAVVFEGSPAWASMRRSSPVIFTAFDPLQRPILHVLTVASPAE